MVFQNMAFWLEEGRRLARDRSDFYVAELRSGLQERAIIAPLPEAARPWRVVFLRSGALRFTNANDPTGLRERHVAAPALVCWPAGAVRDMWLEAGASGAHIALGETFLMAVLSRRPEAAELRDAVQNVTILPLAERPRQEARIKVILDEIAAETDRPASAGFVIAEAQLLCLVVHIWRDAERSDAPARAQGARMALLRRFRQLVEAHHRERWRVRDYASALSVTVDRLHDICSQVLEKTPLQLIHERSRREARFLLTHTNMTLDQIALHLSFRTTSQFNAFFSKAEGAPPGKFRAVALTRSKDQNLDQSVDLSEWP